MHMRRHVSLLYHLFSFAKYTQHFPKYPTLVFLYEAFSPPSPESPSTRHRLLDRTRVGKNEEGGEGEGEGAEGWQIRTSFFVGRGVEWRTDGRVKFAWTLVCVSNFTHAHIQQPREQFGQSAEGGPKGEGGR